MTTASISPRTPCQLCGIEYATNKDGGVRQHGCVAPAVDTIALPWTTPPLTQNQLRRLHYQREAKLKAQAKNEARWAIKAARLAPRVGANVTLHWRVATNRRCDGDGAAPTLKVVLDALVAEGVIPDDSWVHVPESAIRVHPPLRGMPGALWVELQDPDQEES